MRRTIAIAGVAAAAAIAAIGIVRIRNADAIPDLSGGWKSWRSELRIARDGGTYRIAVTNPSGFLGGTYFGRPYDAVLAVSGPLAPLCSEMRYVKDGDKLQFCGEEFARVDRIARPVASAPPPDDRRRDAATPVAWPSVAKAVCAAGDRPEMALQGQVPSPLRHPGGFSGFGCNLALVGQVRGEGAGWQNAFFADRSGHLCSFYDTAPATAGRAHRGTVVVDATDPAKPRITDYLTTPAMIDPQETLKVNDRRQLLVAVSSVSEKAAALDIYDVGADCRAPRLLSPQPPMDAANPPNAQRANEGDFSPDGLTFFATSLRSGAIYPIDITDPAKPKVLAAWSMPFNQRTSGLAIGRDGNRAYFTLYGRGAAAVTAEERNPTNGLVIADVSDVQARRPHPQLRVISSLVWGDGSGSHQVIPIEIGGRPFLIATDEGGSGESNANGWSASCSAGLPPWSMARIVDISDEAHPAIASELKLEMNTAENCAKVLPDLVGLSGFTYGSHYCSVDDPRNATTLACGYFESGIRVFDIRDPTRPREIAYFVPPSVTSPSPGSQNNRSAATGRPDHCSAQVRLDPRTSMLLTTCQDNGFLALKFTHGAWPFRR
jgi:hypothetical protein